MGLQCEACNNNISVTQRRIKCTICSKSFHSECVDFGDTTSLSRNQWKCPSCAVAQRKVGDNSDTPVRSIKAATQTNLNLPATHSKAKDIAIPTMENSGTIPSQITPDLMPHLEQLLDIKLKSIKEEIVAEIKSTILNQIKDEIKAMSSQVKNIENSYQILQNEHCDLKQEIIKMRADITERDNQITELHNSLNKQQQWCRQSNIEVIGLPELSNENPKLLITEIANHAGVKLSAEDVEFAHRVQPFKSIPNRPRSLVIKLKDRNVKDRILSGLRKTKGITTKDIGFAGKPTRFYVFDHLTPNNKVLLKETKDIAAKKSYKFVWVRNCHIFLRKNEESPVLSIASKKDLSKIA
ncbi:uncharacterized protein LOC123699918 [Colias croceus]|uniref:uncharacterized protein LOC123699918 n=1 Tax=Colias crocea TaxID=72248 RepID=UPI001E27BDE5|nr:uncharacterized protein LOC123699918 [Colias croceus]